MSQTSERIRVGIHGAAGRMGQRLVALTLDDPQLELAAALEHPTHPAIGFDAGQQAGARSCGVVVSSALGGAVDVLIDFSVPRATERVLEIAAQRKIPLVVATTGLDELVRQGIAAAAAQIPVLVSPNMSLAVNLTMLLAQEASRTLCDYPRGVDVEIIERHHRFKEDAPSGTALRFGELIAQMMGQTRHTHGRHGRPGKRTTDEIGYHAVRIGDNPGEHTVIFGLMGETIELTVKASSRDCYAIGALAAAKWLVGQPPGRYGMADVLGFRDVTRE